MLERFSNSDLSVCEIMLFVLSYNQETVLTFCPFTWKSCLNLVLAVAYRFVVGLYVVFRAYYFLLCHLDPVVFIAMVSFCC